MEGVIGGGGDDERRVGRGGTVGFDDGVNPAQNECELQHDECGK